MAEEKKEKKYDLAGDRFKLSPRVTTQGYRSTIAGRLFVIDFSKDARGNVVSKYASLCSLQETPEGSDWLPISPPCYEVTNLNERQLFELANAQVVVFNDEQELEYMKLFYPKLYKAKIKRLNAQESLN